MRLDKWTLAFGYTVLSGGNTPNWATSLGQSQIRNYRIKDDDPSINELLKGMTYCSVPVTDVSIRLGRGGSEVSGRQDGHPLVSAAVFSKVYINETLIQDGQFTLLIIRDASASHAGRLILKYAPSIKYTATLEAYSNEMFFDKVREQLNLADDACFFISEINVVDQDKLVLKTHILDPQHSKTFANNEALNAAWNAVADFDIDLPEDAEASDGESLMIESIPDDLSIQELGDILASMYNEAPNKGASIHVFGIKYGAIIIKNGYSPSSIVSAAGINSSYDTEVNKGINIYKAIRDNVYGISFGSQDVCPNEIFAPERYNYALSGEGVNKIFYGVPGCGKSYHIQHEILEKNGYAEGNVIRTTFYQDYSNTDFVGQILPKITKNTNGEDVVEYIFNPGPFTLALIQAIKHPSSKVALVVEEINRGNAPAIFGDIFQLLDRDDSGISEYGIKNVNVIDYLETVNFGTEEAPVYYTFEDIKIPGNLDIFATMNTSDQNVYTLDTAFTRRWAKERIENDFNGNSIETMRVPGMPNVTWGAFVSAVNDRIRAKLDELQVNEDKQVGAFFVKKADLLPAEEVATCDKKKIRLFAYKVLEYLWDDVSKLDHTQLFNPTYTSFEKLVKDYVSNGSAVFNGEITFAIVADSESAS